MESFYTRHGKEIRNLYELAEALREMDYETFHHHVTAERNDFANWIRDCLKDNRLAERLGATLDKEKMELAILKRILEDLER